MQIRLVKMPAEDSVTLNQLRTETAVTTDGCVLEVCKKEENVCIEGHWVNIAILINDLPSSFALESNGGGMKYSTGWGEGGVGSFLMRLGFVRVFGRAVWELGRLDNRGGEGYEAELATISGR